MVHAPSCPAGTTVCLREYGPWGHIAQEVIISATPEGAPAGGLASHSFLPLLAECTVLLGIPDAHRVCLDDFLQRGLRFTKPGNTLSAFLAHRLERSVYERRSPVPVSQFNSSSREPLIPGLLELSFHNQASSGLGGKEGLRPVIPAHLVSQLAKVGTCPECIGVGLEQGLNVVQVLLYERSNVELNATGMKLGTPKVLGKN